jgi:ABC-2 type transport system permease protein
MLARFVRHEWRCLRRDSTLLVLVCVLGLAVAYGVWNGARWVHFQQGTLIDAEREENVRHREAQVQIVRINATNERIASFLDPRLPANAGRRLASRYAALPASPLAALSIGQSDLLPYYFKMTTDAKETVLGAAELENPTRLLSGRFDLAFVVVYLYPLLILALSYDMLSAEKEQGTLALVLSQPVSLARLVLGKLALRAAVFLSILAGFAVSACVAADVRLLTPDALARFAAWIVVVAAYGAFWFALAALVAALGRGSSANAMLLASAWLLLVVLIPSSFNLLVTTLYPVPSRVEMVQAVRIASDEANAEGARLLGRYYQDHPELAAGSPEEAMKDFNVLRVAVADEVERRVRPVIARYDDQIAAQQRMIDRLRFLSPAILAQDALNDVAGTGTARHRHFIGQVEAYHAAWRAYFVPKILARAQLQSYEDVPRFRYAEERTAAVVGRVMGCVAALLVPAALIGWIGVRRMRLYPIAA